MLDVIPTLIEEAKHPLYLQIYYYFKEEIEKGRIPAGTQLPSIRKLASSLQISRNTVENAYQQLLAEGYVISKAKSGLYVIELERDLSSPHFKDVQTAPTTTLSSDDSLTYNFRNGHIDVEHFPFHLWRKYNNQVLRKKANELLQYGHPQGEPELRQEIANYLHRSRGVNSTAEQIIIGAGIQQLLILLSQTIAKEDRIIGFEDPGYIGAREIFTNFGFNLAPISLEENGVNIEQIHQANPKYVYVTPSHQFPIGMILPISKRLKLLQWAEKNNSYIIEDDYDGEFRYHGKPIPSLQGLDQSGRVIYLGTFSKSLLPSIRLAYMVLPPTLLQAYHHLFYAYEPTASRIHQFTLHQFMENGDWERHLRKMRKVYHKKHTTLMLSLRAYMKDKIRVIGNDAGLHILLEIHNKMSEEELINAAETAGVRTYPTSIFWTNPNHNQTPMVMLGFAGLSEQEIHGAIKLLSIAWFT